MRADPAQQGRSYPGDPVETGEPPEGPVRGPIGHDPGGKPRSDAGQPFQLPGGGAVEIDPFISTEGAGRPKGAVALGRGGDGGAGSGQQFAGGELRAGPPADGQMAQSSESEEGKSGVAGGHKGDERKEAGNEKNKPKRNLVSGERCPIIQCARQASN